MLPGDVLAEPGARRSARDWLVDTLMFVLALGIGLLGMLTTAKQHTPVLWVVDLGLGVPSLVALWWRRRYPLGVSAFTLSASIVSGLAGGAGLLSMFNLAIRGSRRTLTWMLALAIVGTAIYPLIYVQKDFAYVWQLVIGWLMNVLVVGWGLFARAQRDLIRALHERSGHLVEQAREAERRRIAGEMHDVLAHRLSLLSVHAGALEFNPDADVTEAAGVIRATARDALQDLRDVIGVLRDDPSVGPPQPTLAEIPALVEESRAAGMRVSAQIEAHGGDATVGRTAYRVVQEGLTNARKHAPAALVDVTVAAGERLLVQVVSRRGFGPAPDSRGTGTGLIGLTERVALAGGELEHGPDAHGDFVLRATLPWT